MDQQIRELCRQESSRAMMDVANYIAPGDRVCAVPTGIGDAFTGKVIAVYGQELGEREYVIELDKTLLWTDGALGLPESGYVFEVERGDCWIVVPRYLSAREAHEKSTRAQVSSRKRIERDIPLFASQLEPEHCPPETLRETFARRRQEDLEREHAKALEANETREQVRQVVTPEDFEILLASRSRYPRHSVYAIHFWRKQLQHIAEHGTPEIWKLDPHTGRLMLAVNSEGKMELVKR